MKELANTVDSIIAGNRKVHGDPFGFVIGHRLIIVVAPLGWSHDEMSEIRKKLKAVLNIEDLQVKFLGL